jgi:hypothetical protein
MRIIEININFMFINIVFKNNIYKQKYATAVVDLCVPKTTPSTSYLLICGTICLKLHRSVREGTPLIKLCKGKATPLQA